MDPYSIRPLRRKVSCPRVMSARVKSTCPEESTTFPGIGGSLVYVRYARSPITKNPNMKTITMAWPHRLETISPRLLSWFTGVLLVLVPPQSESKNMIVGPSTACCDICHTVLGWNTKIKVSDGKSRGWPSFQAGH